MTDLTLDEYRDLSEAELKRMLKAKALEICGADTPVKNKVVFSLADTGGRRSGTDRRQFSYHTHIPERRSGRDRRSGKDRRNNLVSRMHTKSRRKTEREADLP